MSKIDQKFRSKKSFRYLFFINRNFFFFFAILNLLQSQAFDGLTLFSVNQTGPGGGNVHRTYLIDNQQNIIHSWSHDRGAASMPYLMQDSSLVYPYRVVAPSMSTGGVGGGVAIYSWTGDLLWSHEIANELYQHHHDIQPLPNGNILMLVWERHLAIQNAGNILYGGEGKGWQQMGRTGVNNNINQMWSTAILEIVPYSDVDSIVWEWHVWDHLVQDINPDLPNYGSVSNSPNLLDINYGDVGGNVGQLGPNADWLHCNAIDYNEALDQIAISSRHTSEIYIIDHSTTTLEASSDSGGNSGMGGNFLYRWGNPQVYKRGSSSDQKLFGQHGVNWIPSGYPGSGNLIIFNNDYTSNTSAVFELQPPINTFYLYDLQSQSIFGPDEPIWYHTGEFHSNVQSGAFRLPNGNTLITDANSSRIFEVTLENNLVWDYNHPGGGHMIPRAQKYSFDYLGIGFPDFINGDINLDGAIDLYDILLLSDMINGAGYAVNPPADFVQDDIINATDIIALAAFIMNY